MRSFVGATHPEALLFGTLRTSVVGCDIWTVRMQLPEVLDIACINCEIEIDPARSSMKCQPG
jgi:hypothetical protein